MSDIIQILPDSVANQIAAGEVIQRPASVIKELVENAIDAGATSIEVSVVDAGRTSIQVIDNGKGMSETDARLSFERHATSKIKQASDLFGLQTMGFRGEALASIAAVAEVELKTRLEGAELGTQLIIAGSRFVSQEPCSCPQGSNFLVKNLFYNVPARRKFLKSNATEMNNIITAFERIALVYPEINFILYGNNTELQHLRATTVRQRIVDIFGRRINQDLIPLEVNTTMCRISGFVGKPESAKKKGALQYFFVNGRYMRHPYFAKAVQTAMERLVPVSEQIPFFIYFNVDPGELDVNIHPTKTEIKFENEQAIWQVLQAAVKDAVGLFSNITALDFESGNTPEIPLFNPDGMQQELPKVQINPRYNPFNGPSQPRKQQVPSQWQDLYAPKQQVQSDEELFQSPAETALDSPSTPQHFQYKGQYIITSVKSGLMIVDQHRAHFRILFDQFMQRMGEKGILSQQLLYPEMLQLSASEAVQLQEIMTDLYELGFDLSDLGANNFSVNAVPAGLEETSIASLLQELLTVSADKKIDKADLHHDVALRMARHGAVAYGQLLTNNEMDSIINQLFQCRNLNYAPDGKRILSIIEQGKIDQMFK